jgi:hypothetical protein
MDEAILDAHLYALGITPDARKLRVLVLGNDALATQIEHRVRHFGAESLDDVDDVFPQGDFAIITNLAAGVESVRDNLRYCLKPGARYMILIDGVASPPDLVVIDHQLIDSTAMRVIGMKPLLDVRERTIDDATEAEHYTGHESVPGGK